MVVIKRIIFVPILIMILSISCVMEPPTTRYSFKIVNRTNSNLLIDFKTVKYGEQGNGTLMPSKIFEKSIIQLGCFKDHGDTLLQSFFSELNIRLINANINVNPYDRAKWVDSLDLKGSGNCKGGIVYYTLTVFDKDLK